MFWQHFWRPITLAAIDVLAVSTESQVLSSFIIKVMMDTPIFLFYYLLLIALYTNSIYIIWLKKIFYSILFSKFLTLDYILFFVPSSSIADSDTVWLDTYIKIIVICRDIHRTLRKLQQLTGKNIFIFFLLVIYLLANTHSPLSNGCFKYSLSFSNPEWFFYMGKCCMKEL